MFMKVLRDGYCVLRPRGAVSSLKIIIAIAKISTQYASRKTQYYKK